MALASLWFLEGDCLGAVATAGEGLEELLALKNQAGVVMALDWIAALAAPRMPLDAFRLAGAAERLRVRHGGGMRPESIGLEPARECAARLVAELEAVLAFDEGSGLDLEEAVSLARRLVSDARVPAYGEKVTPASTTS